MSATVDTTDLSYGAGAVSGSRPAVFSAISGSPLWYLVYAKTTGTYYATSADGTAWTTHSAFSGLAGRAIGATAWSGVRDIAGNLYYAYPGNDQDGSVYMLFFDGSAWDGSPSVLAGGFGGALAHLYEGASTYFRAFNVYSNPTMYRTTSPSASTATWVNDQAFTGNNDGTASAAILTQGANVVAVWRADIGGTITLRSAEFDLDSVPVSTEFPTADVALTDTDLHKQFAACVDADGLIHVIYRIEGDDWYEATYDGATWTTGGTIPQMTDDDLHPALMCDGAGDLHLLYARYNASSDYGIGYIKHANGGSWSAQSDFITHNAVDRTSINLSDTTSDSAALVTWVEGGTTIKAQELTVAPLGVNPVAATITRDAVGPSSVSFSVEATGGTEPYTYQWYRDTLAGFVPSGANDLVGETADTLTDTPPDDQIYYYKCVVTDDASEDDTSNQLPGQLYESTYILGFIGDSITSQTSGGGIKTCEVMGSRLRIKTGIRTVTIVDESQGGSGTGQWQPGDTFYDDAVTAFTSAGVTHVMVMLGTNGLSTSQDFDQGLMDDYLADMGTIVDELVLDGFTVVINASPYISLTAYEKANSFLQAMSEQLDTLTDGVDIFMGDTKAYTWFAQHPEELIDGVHPTVLGIQSLGGLWADAFENAIHPPTGGGGGGRRRVW